jgi:hypothetical protein
MGVAFDFSRGWPKVFAPLQPDRDMTLEVRVKFAALWQVVSKLQGLASIPTDYSSARRLEKSHALCSHEVLPASPSMTRSCVQLKVGCYSQISTSSVMEASFPGRSWLEMLYAAHSLHGGTYCHYA